MNKFHNPLTRFFIKPALKLLKRFNCRPLQWVATFSIKLWSVTTAHKSFTTPLPYPATGMRTGCWKCTHRIFGTKDKIFSKITDSQWNIISMNEFNPIFLISLEIGEQIPYPESKCHNQTYCPSNKYFPRYPLLYFHMFRPWSIQSYDKLFPIRISQIYQNMLCVSFFYDPYHKALWEY